MDFSNKVFIVTGSSSGIGRGCAERIVSLGGRVIGIDRNESSFSHSLYSHYRADVLDEERISRIVRDASDVYGHIYGLVNAAGIWGCGRPLDRKSVV